MESQKSVRILSIDGGGSWALIPVQALIQIYGANTRGHEVLRNFDYVAANSGGSLVVAGLICDFTLAEVLALFKSSEKRTQVFAPLSLGAKIFRAIPRLFKVGARYSTAGKLAGLTRIMGGPGQQMLSKLVIPGRTGNDVRFVFMAYNYDRDRASYLRSYKSQAGSIATQPSTATLVEAVHASTNAPINYFDEPAQLPPNRRYWDGGLTGFNNPVLAAVSEAIANGAAAKDINVLSLGTATAILPLKGAGDTGPDEIYKAEINPGLLNDIRKAASTILQDPPDAHTFLAHLMLGGTLPKEACLAHPSAIVRMNPLIQPLRDANNAWVRPAQFTAQEFGDLVKMDIDAIQDSEVALIERLCNAWINGLVNNQAVRPAEDLSCEIGYPTFADAMRAWKTLTP